MPRQPIPLGKGFYKRAYAEGPFVNLVNRFLEADPTNLVEQMTLLSRPGVSTLLTTGASPFRATWSQLGMFNGDLFFVNNSTLFRYDGTTITTITGTLANNGAVKFAPQWGNLPSGQPYNYLFMSDGATLQYYPGATTATGTLTISSSTAAAATATLTATGKPSGTVQINNTYYVFTGGTLAGFQDGLTPNTAWRVLAETESGRMQGLADAINANPSSNHINHKYLTSPNADVSATNTSSTVVITALNTGSAANSFATKVISATAMSWGGSTMSGGVDGTEISNQVIKIGSVYYTWNSSVSGTADGTSSHPWIALLGSSSDGDSISNMVSLIMATGTPGVTYSAGITTPSATVTAAASTSGGVLTMVLTSIGTTSAANSIATTVASGTGMSWGASTLSGAGSHALISVPMPNGVAPNALTQVSSYVLVSVANSQTFYYINPGETTISGLNFFNKESQADYIVDMYSIGDQAVICGQSSTENWYATGNTLDALAPYEGRVYQRGVIKDTGCVVKDTLVIVANNGIVYAIGYMFGTEDKWGINRISDNSIEELVRIQIRAERGLGGSAGTRGRSWTFTFDGHSFYVLDLGPTGTYVYDTSTQKWSNFNTDGYSPVWNFCNGNQWDQRIVACDTTASIMYEMIPSNVKDQGTLDIKHSVVGLLPARDRVVKRLDAVRVTGSIGFIDESSGATVTLSYSDDNGTTWSTPVSVTLTAGNTTMEIAFRSLGSFAAPGRVFDFTDTGGLIRIDAADAFINGFEDAPLPGPQPGTPARG